MNETLKTIADRRSIRAYESTPIPENDLQTILTAGLQAPSGMNRQQWHFTAITNPQLLEEFNAGQSMMPSLTYGAPALILITAPKNSAEMGTPESAFAHGKSNGVNCGIVVQNMALAAWSLGYGNVILGMPGAVFEGEQGPYFMEKFGIPEGHEFVIGLAVGKTVKSKDVHKLHPEKITIIR